MIFCAFVEFCVLFEVLFRKGDRYLILCFTGKETSHKERLIQVWSTNFLIPNLVLIPPKSCQEVEMVAIIIVMVADTERASVTGTAVGIIRVRYPIPRRHALSLLTFYG